MVISAEIIKQLRERTGVSVMECKKALEQSEGDIEKAIHILKERSTTIAAKKSDRELGAGAVVAYIHTTGQVGAMVLLSSETDFVSKNEEFAALGRDIAMHIVAMRPESIEALLEQVFIKDSTSTVANVLSAATQKFGERIEISKMGCFSVV